jgi:hypothetical protein
MYVMFTVTEGRGRRGEQVGIGGYGDAVAVWMATADDVFDGEN